MGIRGIRCTPTANRGNMEPSTPRPRLEARRTNERPHVLVVSDDPGLTDFLAEGLPLGGFWVSVIASGIQALEVFRLRQFDMVLVDADMSSFDSVEFINRLRGVSHLDSSREPRTLAPAVVIHATAGDENTHDDPAMGVSRELYPPLELDELVRILHEVFQEWRQAHPTAPLADSSANRAF